jgi:hypothetical protein
MALPPVPVPRRAVVISPWMENLLWQYRAAILAPSRRRWPRYLLTLAAMLVITWVALSPALLIGRIRAAYPSEPVRQRALELCGRADPTFVRFLASERAACYAHFRELIAGTSADSR